MAFNNYQDLQDGVAAWLNRENAKTLARVPDFIVFGENRIFRQLRTRYNEVLNTFDSGTLDNTQGVIIPADYKETKIIAYDDKQLTRKSDQWLLQRDPTAAGGTPLYFIRLVDQLKFWPPPDNNNDVKLIYYNQQVHIDGANIPPLYLQFPELYVYAALLEGKGYLRYKQDAATWQYEYDRIMSELELEQAEEEYSGSTVTSSAIYADAQLRHVRY